MGGALLGIADTLSASAVLLLAFNPLAEAVLRDENHRLHPSVFDNYRR